MLSIHARKVTTGQAVLQRGRLQKRKLKRKKRTSIFEAVFQQTVSNARTIGALGACLQYTGKYHAVLRRKRTTRDICTARTKGVKEEIHDTIVNKRSQMPGRYIY